MVCRLWGKAQGGEGCRSKWEGGAPFFPKLSGWRPLVFLFLRFSAPRPAAPPPPRDRTRFRDLV